MIKSKLKVTRFDWEGFEKAIKDRWETDHDSKMTHCKKHNTYFKYEGEPNDATLEPCWQCHSEFEETIDD